MRGDRLRQPYFPARPSLPYGRCIMSHTLHVRVFRQMEYEEKRSERNMPAASK
jgi:hypothetical protein